jgi:hypothetical protein
MQNSKSAPKQIDKVQSFSEFVLGSEIRTFLIKQLHEGVKMIRVDRLNESSKYPELKRMLDKAKSEGSELLIADFVPEIEALVDKFGQSGQSGGSAPFTAGAIVETIRKMLAQEPLGEGIDCTDDEWNDCSMYEDTEPGRGTYQNNRLSSVFKEGKEGRPYYLNAIVFKPIGKDYSFTGNSVGLDEDSKDLIGSSHYIKSLPFQPKTFTIDVYEREYRRLEDGTLVEEQGGGWWESWLADPKQLDEVWEYYDKMDRKRKKHHG